MGRQHGGNARYVLYDDYALIPGTERVVVKDAFTQPLLAEPAPPGVPQPMKPRRAFTLLEMLVVILIIAILTGLVLSALQRARAAALVTRCQDNLHQIGLGMMSFNAQQTVFPSNGGWDGEQTIPSTTGDQFTPETYIIYPGIPLKWGTGDPKLSAELQTGSWAYSILPYVEQDSKYVDRSWMEAEPLYICTARRSVEPVTCVAQDSQCVYTSGGWAWGKTDYAANAFAVPLRPLCRDENEFTKGLSNIILVGEKAYNPSRQGNTWFYDEPYFLGGATGTARGGEKLVRDGNNITFKHHWGSNHSHGADFLFGDGSVRMLGFGTDQATMKALLRLR